MPTHPNPIDIKEILYQQLELLAEEAKKDNVKLLAVNAELCRVAILLLQINKVL